tara:strand:- start:566 stop:2110 length:1545 start_codon:yes stop_codon:yes gene_type:complete
MTPTNLALRIDQGATFRALLRLMQPSPVYKPITDIAPTGPVRLTVEHGLPGDWPVWVEHVRQLPEANRAPLRQLPHMAQVVTATELDLPGINATGTRPEGGQLVYRPPLDLTDATAELRLYEKGAEVGTLPVTVNAGGWIDVELSAAETADLAWRSREYVLDVTLPNGDVLRAYTGTITVEVAGAAAGQVCHGAAVVSGDRGPAGPGVAAATVAENGHLILTLQDGTEIDAGVIDRPWGTIQGEITEQLDLMYQLGLKVDQTSYDAFAAGVAAGLAERYTKPETDALVASRTTPAQAAAAAPVQSVQGRAGDVAIAKADVGLGSADNTSDMAKPVSTAQAAALALKVNVTDVLDQLESADATKPLSANQGRVLKELIDNIQTLLESDNINLDSLQEVVDFIEQNREDLQNLGISNIAGLQDALDSKAATNGDYVNLRARATTAADVGLGQVDNTPDASKPISSPQQAGLDLKVDKVVGKGLSTEDFTTDQKNKLAALQSARDLELKLAYGVHIA